jgi:hypothetical protein
LRIGISSHSSALEVCVNFDSKGLFQRGVIMQCVLAYFDPGSGSLLVQALVGGGAGLLVFAKYLWGVLRSRSLRRQAVED